MRKINLQKGLFVLLLFIGLVGNVLGQQITGTTATASDEKQPASNAVDGSTSTRWETNTSAGDPQWIVVDLGAPSDVGKIRLDWNGSSSKRYTLKHSLDNATWTLIDSLVDMENLDHRIDNFNDLAINCRYIQMYGYERTRPYGHSMYEFEVYETFTPVLTSLEVLPNFQSVLPGATPQYTVTGSDQLGDPVDLTDSTIIWSVDGIGSIDANGLVTTTVADELTVTATVSGISDDATLTVYTPELTSLILTSDKYSIIAGEGAQFSVTGEDQMGEPMAITSEAWTIVGVDCSIDNSGTLTTTADATGYYYAKVEAGSVNGTVVDNINFSVGNYAIGATATASDEKQAASNAIDGDVGSRWETNTSAGDPQWIVVDLGAAYDVGKIRLDWNGSSSMRYTLKHSLDNTNWTLIDSLVDMENLDHRIDDFGNLGINCRYIQMYGYERTRPYGHSMYEFEVYGVVAPFLSSIVVDPSSVMLAEGTSQTFTGEGRDQNGDAIAIAGPTDWSVDGTGSSIDAGGVLTTTKPGIFTITAENSSFSATATADIIPTDENVALGKNASATSNKQPASNAVDDDEGTRWESDSSDPQSIVIDLDAPFSITGFRIKWQNANSKNYIVEGSNDSASWTTIATKTNMPTGERTDVIYDLGVCNYQYVRITGTDRNTEWGHSIWDFKIYAEPKTTPVITWENPADITYGTALSTTQLNATAVEAGSWEYSAAIDSVMDLGDAQEISVIFTPTDELAYSSAYDTVLINVTKANAGITWADPDDIVYGTPISATQLNATSNVDGTLVYSAAIDSIMNAGDAQKLSVIFTPTDIANNNIAYDTVTINVSKATPLLTWAKPDDIDYGTPLSSTQLNASANVDGTMVYSAAIDSILAIGNDQPITVDFTPADANYDIASKTVTITVLDPTKLKPVITWADPDDIVYGTPLSATQLNATADVEGTFIYSAAIDSVMDVGDAQELSVSFTPNDAVTYSSASKAVNINVSKGNPVITWADPDDIVYSTPLSATQLNATADIAGTMVYSAAIDSIMDVGGAQKLSVIFTPTNIVNYNIANDTVTINVTKATPIITWATPDAIDQGTPLSATQLNATADISGTMVYSAAIDSILAIGDDQPLTVDFTPTDGNYNNASKTVYIDVLYTSKLKPVITWNNPADIIYGTPLGTTQLNATADVGGTFKYSAAIDSIMDAGDAQALSVSFTPNDTLTYALATKIVNINVSKGSPVITWNNPDDIVYGTPLGTTQLNATVDVEGTLNYSAAIDSILAIGNNQSLTVNFTPEDTANYNNASKTVSINVLTSSQLKPVITWSNPDDIIYGIPLSNTQLNATANVDGTFKYSAAIDSVLNAGYAQELSVAFTPMDELTFSTVSSTVHINVSKAIPVITWADPDDIVYGTPLGATQLNASADVDGSFEYTPAAETVLEIGDAQDLTVLFTAADTTNYNYINKTVKINVIEVIGVNATSNLIHKVFPNPFTENITVLNLESDSFISIYDLFGKEIIRERTTGNKAELRVGNLPEGVYIMIIQSNNSTFTKRIVKQ
ncbi:MAG: discoidin domain-containing protein [Salinivirgaceae bacterium]|jgi:phage-related protein|nr:discoidin domain-containing protein [Salinivirgaceae bacterium]